MRTPKLLVSALLGAVAVWGCGDDPEPTPVPQVPETCKGSTSPTVEVGQGVGGAFVPLADGAETGLISAPQGGFGVAVVLRSRGLEVAGDEPLELALDIEIQDENAGHFEVTRPALCQSDGSGGLINGIVIGLDSGRYGSNDALLALDGAIIDLVVTATDTEGRAATVRKPVTLNVGG